MGEKGMDTGGMSASGMGVQTGTATGTAQDGNESNAQATGDPPQNVGPGTPPAPASSGPNAGEIVGDILDPLGIHKLFG